MKNLTLTIEEELALLDKYRLTPTELMFIRTLLILQEEDNQDALFCTCIKVLKQGGVSLHNLIATLQDKEVILKSYKICKSGEEFDPYAIPINKNFTKNLYKCSFEMGKELFEAYPQFGYINNAVIPIRTVAKKYDSLEQAYFKYGKAIGWNPERHQKIIELVNWARENNIINCSLASFIVNNGWMDLEAIKNGTGGANINYDAVKML